MLRFLRVLEIISLEVERFTAPYCYGVVTDSAPNDRAMKPEEVASELERLSRLTFLHAEHPEVRARYCVVCNDLRTDFYDVRSPDDAREVVP